MGKIVVGVVALAMFAFILTDLLQSNSSLMGGNDRTVAEIAGEDIGYEKFQAKVDELSYVFSVNNGRNPLADEMETIREQAWNALILEYAYGEQFEELGITVTDAEVVDMVQGNNINPQLKQFFTDPNTGQFSREQIVSFLQSLNSPEAQPAQKASWLTLETTLAPNRKVSKYENLLEKTNYVTTAEAKKEYETQNSNMSVDYVYVPFFSAADSLFDVSSSEMESYLSKNSEKYQREESRSLKYVVLPIEPSPEDSAYIMQEITALKEGLVNAANDSTYAALNSDGLEPYRSITDPSLVPEGLVGAEAGTVTEPTIVGNKYVVSKLSDVTDGDEAFVKARHILIESDGTSPSAKAEARQTAQDIINQLQQGADFNQLAAMNSADQSNARNGGDLGWIGEEGSFVQSFKDAIFAHRGTGLIPRPVETSYGYHIIRIDEPKTTTLYEVATIEKEFFASDETLNETYRKADLLAANSSSEEELAANAAEGGFSLKSASSLKRNDTRVGTVTDARRVVMWLYNDASVDEVSEVFELDNNYMVAVMTGKQAEGTANLSQVEPEIRTKVLNKKKADHIIKKLSDATGDDLATVSDGYGDDARDGQADLSLSSNSFPGVGFAPDAIGVAFSLNEGERTAPFAIDNGVIMIQATTKSLPAEMEDYSPYVSQVVESRRARKTVIANFPLSFYPVFISQSVDNAIKENAEIEDKRYKFF